MAVLDNEQGSIGCIFDGGIKRCIADTRELLVRNMGGSEASLEPVGGKLLRVYLENDHWIARGILRHRIVVVTERVFGIVGLWVRRGDVCAQVLCHLLS